MTMNVTPASLTTLASAALFAGFVGTTLVGAIAAVAARRLVRSVSGLALCFLGLAGLYYYLNSPFMALMQMLIYIGAICVTIMFAMMLTELHERPAPRAREIALSAASLVVAALFGVGLIALVGRAAWRPTVTPPGPASIQDLGRALLTRFGFAFELISVVLLLAILGALVVARSGRRTKP